MTQIICSDNSLTAWKKTLKTMERILKSKYKILDKLSESYSSAVYKGAHVDDEKPLIIRIFKRDYLNSVLIKKLKKESLELSKLIHPSILKLIDGDYGWQGFYFIREYSSGISLEDVKKPLEIDKLLNIANEICEAVSFAHAGSIIHGGIDSQNIFIENDLKIKIGDFRIKNLFSGLIDKKSEMLIKNNMDFISPEEVLGENPAVRSDIYNIGLALFLLSTGQKAFKGNTNVEIAMKHSKESISAPSSINPKIPKFLDDIILKCLEKDPLLRFENVLLLKESIFQKAVVSQKPFEFELPDINYYSDPTSPATSKAAEEEKPSIKQSDEKKNEPKKDVKVPSPINVSKWFKLALWISIAAGIIYSLIHIFFLE